MKYRERIPGYVIRTLEGDLIGLRCPISGQSFYGEHAERDQFNHTLALYQAQGMDEPLSIAERKQLYQAGQGR